ncbi:hypothetical protein I6B53_07180 [Schaalia sp. 19OD2882]|uniref:hypothetical protein n=1 Tax=Schaalia sp. 19OD2882 TaxID=2794089 RepID=UPI001C1F0C9C|nr:hypothetical protein [Schaalia sp. 19OD2882]QWW18925.1 hypothetical protein I6B53_07180 [Schaalia sp. 19OD2882]
MDERDDIDAQFRDLVAQFGDEAAAGISGAADAPADPGTPDAPEDLAGREASPSPSESGAVPPPPADRVNSALDTPVDESLHLEGGRLSVALVLAPLPSPEALHSLLSFAGKKVDVVGLKPWTAVWLRVETRPTDEDELDALLAGCRAMPEPVDEVARVISRLSRYGAVAVMSWLVEGDGVEPGVSGRISARRYVSGAPEDEIPAGVLLGSMPQAAEDLLLGRTCPKDYDDSVSADGTTRRKPGPMSWFRRR